MIRARRRYRKGTVFHALLAALLMAASSPAPIIAQETASDPAITYVIRLFDTVLTYAPPPWVTDMGDIADVETFRDQGRTGTGSKAFILEFIPKGETFDAWTRLYAILAQTPYDGTLEAYRAGQIQTYIDSCAAPQWRISPQDSEHKTLFSIYCPHYKSDPRRGEVAFFSMILRGETLVKTYYHIRVPAFSLGDLSQPGTALPISDAQLEKALWTIEQAQLTDAQ